MSFLEWFPHTVHTVSARCGSATKQRKQRLQHLGRNQPTIEVRCGTHRCDLGSQNVELKKKMLGTCGTHILSSGQVPPVLEFPLWDKSRSQPRLRHPKASQGTRQTPGPLNYVALVEGLTQSPAGRVFYMSQVCAVRRCTLRMFEHVRFIY